MNYYSWNAARAASNRPPRKNNFVFKLVGPGQLFTEDDRACRYCGYHVHASTCIDATMTLSEAEQFLRAAPEDNGVVAVSGPNPGRVYFCTTEGTFMFVSNTNPLRPRGWTANFLQDARGCKFRRATELDRSNSR